MPYLRTTDAGGTVGGMSMKAVMAGRPARDRVAARLFSTMASRFAAFAGQPAAFAAAFSLILLWIVTGPMFAWSDTWQLVVNTATTIVTFLMVFLIQNSQNRDAAAIQAKLDEVIRAMENARNEFIGIEHLSDGEIEVIRGRLEEQVGRHGPGRRRADSVRRLLGRR
jgi:low affinity Fe/Cu permease